MLRLALLTLAFVATAYGYTKSYQDYTVYRVDVTSPEDIKTVEALTDNEYTEIWNDIRLGPVDIMLTPETKEQFVRDLESANLKFNLMVPNVETLIRSEAMDQLRAKASAAPREMTFDAYHDLDTFYEYFDQLAAASDDVSVESIGKSYEGRDMRVLKICRGGCGNKPAMWIDGGIHAREWISPAAVMWVVKELTENLSAENDDLVANLDWYILPSANPDGYAYSQTDDRLWRKTRSIWEGNSCKGVDANRNWDYEWNTGGSSDFSCQQDYHGPYAFSEVENVNMKNFLEANKDQIKFYNNVHSYSQLILLPWGFTETPCPGYDDMFALMTKANEALFNTHGKEYEVGCIPCMLYVASGGSIDWTLGEIGVKYSIGMELRDTGNFGFLLPPSQIIPTGEEVFAFHQVVARQIIEEFA